jgi:hypothetical protein
VSDEKCPECLRPLVTSSAEHHHVYTLANVVKETNWGQLGYTEFAYMTCSCGDVMKTAVKYGKPC